MNAATVLALLGVALGTVATAHADEGCMLNICEQLNTQKEPLLLKVDQTRDKRETLNLIYPTEVEYNGKTAEGILRINEGKALTVACPGKNNYVEATGEPTGSLVCSNGKLSINGLKANNESLACTSGIAKSWVENTNEECGKGDNVGTKFMIGFMLPDENEEETFFPMIEVCHNTVKMVSYYSNHEVYGESLEGSVTKGKRPKFTKDGSFVGVNPDQSYSKERQLVAIDAILGAGRGKHYSEENKIFLARGHLAPDADFIYNTGQQSTYYYINAAPQWQNFNAYNWLKIENAVRQLARKERLTLNVWTGTYGILKLDDKEIYLEPKELDAEDSEDSEDSQKSQSDPEESDYFKQDLIAVPEVYWKIVQHPDDHRCTVVVGHNNVFLENKPTPICNKVVVNGWPKEDEFPLNRGNVYYCDFNSFKQIVDYLPAIECTAEFAFPTAKESDRKKPASPIIPRPPVHPKPHGKPKPPPKPKPAGKPKPPGKSKPPGKPKPARGPRKPRGHDEE